MNNNALLVVISGPSGVGKTTITHALVDRLSAVFSVSMTTRPITAADTEGVDYFFVDQAAFDQKVERGELLEWARVFDYCYGTPRPPVEDQLTAGHDVILEIDVKGAIQVKAAMPQALSIFVLPPSEEELLRRLRNRAREDETIIQRRFREAQREISEARSCGAYDHFVVNHVLEDAVEEAYRIVAEHKQRVSTRSC